MGLPDTLPCKCMNPRCGINFYARNPVGGSGGINNTFSGNMTNCPQCGQLAMYADWSTDSKGNFHIKDIFNFVHEFKDIKKLEALKTNLKAANNTFTSKELSDTLVKVDSGFKKFEDVLESIPFDKVHFFKVTLIEIITFLIAFYSIVLSEEHHDETINFEREKFDYQKQQDRNNQATIEKHHDETINLEREKFEYQKQQDKNNQARKNKESKELIAKKIKDLEFKFEELLKEDKIKLHHLQIVGNKKPKGAERNKLCNCGSGLKAKQCYINALIRE